MRWKGRQDLRPGDRPPRLGMVRSELATAWVVVAIAIATVVLLGLLPDSDARHGEAWRADLSLKRIYHPARDDIPDISAADHIGNLDPCVERDERPNWEGYAARPPDSDQVLPC